MHLAYRPKFCITIVSNFSWEYNSRPKRNPGQWFSKMLGVNKVHYGLCENGKLFIAHLNWYINSSDTLALINVILFHYLKLTLENGTEKDQYFWNCTTDCLQVFLLEPIAEFILDCFYVTLWLPVTVYAFLIIAKV